MAFVHNGITLNPNKAWVHQDGRQFPAGYILTTDIATRESIGVTMVSDVAPAYYDQEYYWSPDNPKNLDELKAKKIADTKNHCASVLRLSDELVTKALDEATSFAEFKAAKPANYTTYRAAMRTVSNTREAEINACTTVEQLRELFKGSAQVQQTDSEGNGIVHPDTIEETRSGETVTVANPIAGTPVMIANPALATAWPELAES
jgi:hypothetical protein|tara:strand:+ start:1289 stop:1903 length:615 start_codon:yes stop_codon:yes gene_type:complete